MTEDQTETLEQARLPGVPEAPDQAEMREQTPPSEQAQLPGTAEPPGQTGTLEEALSRTEQDAANAIAAASAALGALRRVRAMARQGRIRDLQNALGGAETRLRTLDQAVANLASSYDFDEEEYLRSGRYLQELIARANEDGLGLTEQDGRIYAYPVLMRLLPADRAVLIDKTRERRLRPSALVALLKDIQRRPPRFRPAEFLESLYRAYQAATRGKEEREGSAPVVTLVDIHDLLTMLPGQAREYSRQEFARDLYLLDQSGETTTRDGARLEFHASTGTRLARGTLTVIDRDGREKRYWGIAFASAQGG
jgi:hypothetical protein